MRVRRVVRRVLSILILTSMITSSIGCGTKEMIVEAAVPNGEMYTDYNKLTEKERQFTTDAEFISSVKQFSNNSTIQLLKGTKDNISYSPISLYFALAVLTEGSENDTAKELFQSMGISKVDYDYLAKNVDQLYRRLYCDTDQKKLKIANAVWLDKNFKFLSSYGETVSKLYHSSVFCMDFKNAKTAKKMEEWIAKQLNNVMQPKVDISDMQVLTIMNTIYYAGRWKDIFFANQTREDQFHVDKDTTVTCDFMNKENREDFYVDGDGFKLYEMPIEGGDSMIFCLPDDDVDIDELLESCESVDSLFAMSTKKNAHIILSLPKFDYEYKMDLTDALQQLGVKKAMDSESADFSRISKLQLYLSKATQQVHITVDEEGVVGAAYTEFGVECTCAEMPKEYEKVVLNFNRPFLYQIITKNRIPIFTGIVRNPTIN